MHTGHRQKQEKRTIHPPAQQHLNTVCCSQCFLLIFDPRYLIYVKIKMWNSSDTSFRSEYEIGAMAVRRFYQYKERPLNDALDAVISGCVTEYTFDTVDKKFVGTVISFDGIESYEVKVIDLSYIAFYSIIIQESIYSFTAVHFRFS